MAKFTVVLQDANGNVQTGLDVDLYTGNGSGPKYGDFISNADGSYSINVTTSGLYTVKVDGSIETELQTIYIPTEDIESRITTLNTDVGDLQEAFSLHKISADHDGRYYTEAEIDAMLAGLTAAGLAGVGLYELNDKLNVGVDNAYIEIDLNNNLKLKYTGLGIGAGEGLTGGGNPNLGESVVLDVNVDNATLAVVTDVLKIKDSGVGLTQLAQEVLDLLVNANNERIVEVPASPNIWDFAPVERNRVRITDASPFYYFNIPLNYFGGAETQGTIDKVEIYLNNTEASTLVNFNILENNNGTDTNIYGTPININIGSGNQVIVFDNIDAAFDGPIQFELRFGTIGERVDMFKFKVFYTL